MQYRWENSRGYVKRMDLFDIQRRLYTILVEALKQSKLVIAYLVLFRTQMAHLQKQAQSWDRVLAVNWPFAFRE